MDKISIIFLFLIISISIIPLSCAETQTLGTFKQGECINLIQTCSNCSYVNISTILYPNSTIALSDIEMTKSGTYYNYTFCDTNATGNYIYNTYGDLDGNILVQPVDFKVTYGGVSDPNGSSTIFFGAGYILFLFGFIYLIIYSLGHAIQVDFDLKDLAINFGSYFGFIIFNLLAGKYFAEATTQNIGEWAILIGSVTFVILPILYFILTLTIGSWMNRRIKGVDY